MFSLPLRIFGSVVLKFKADPKLPPTYSSPSFGPNFLIQNLLIYYLEYDSSRNSYVVIYRIDCFKKELPERIRLSVNE